MEITAENTTRIIGDPSWSAQVLPDGRAYIRVTYPAGSDVSQYQTLRLPMEDLPALADQINNLINWKPSSHRGEEDATEQG